MGLKRFSWGACLALGLVLTACTGPSRLEGQVRDLFGRPVPATVRIGGLRTTCVADEAGQYALPYVPGRFEAVYQADGYLERRISWDLYAEARVEAAPVVMIPYPPGPGLWLAGEEDYRPVRAVSPALHASRDLGLMASSRRYAVMVEPPEKMCVDQALVAWLSEESRSPPFLILKVGPDGLLWTEGTEPLLLSDETLEQEALSERLWWVRPRVPGRFALVPDGADLRIRATRVYGLEVRLCDKDPGQEGGR